MNRPILQPNEDGLFETRRKTLYATGCIYELTKWITVGIIFITLLHFFVVTISIVDGISMLPNFQNGEYILINRFQYIFGKPARGDAVVLRFEGDPDNKKYIKRIVGLPGEKVEVKEGHIYINGKMLVESYIPADIVTSAEKVKEITLPKDNYYIVGDNRYNSNDSRIWGPASRRYLMGKAWLQFYPQIEKIEDPKYSL